MPGFDALIRSYPGIRFSQTDSTSALSVQFCFCLFMCCYLFPCFIIFDAPFGVFYLIFISLPSIRSLFRRFAIAKNIRARALWNSSSWYQNFAASSKIFQAVSHIFCGFRRLSVDGTEYLLSGFLECVLFANSSTDDVRDLITRTWKVAVEQGFWLRN